MIDIEMVVAAMIEGGPREKLAYATENIVSLLARISPDGLRDATADIVVDQVKGLKKSWLNKAIKDHQEKMLAEVLQEHDRRTQVAMERRRQEYLKRVEEAQDAYQDAAEDAYRDSLLAAKDETIAALREQLEQANERDRENRRIIAALTSRIPAIEAPQEPPGGPETAESPKRPLTDEERAQEGAQHPWWRRVFGG
jgi:hypothetical protein